MKTRIFLILAVIMISFWLNQHNVKANEVIDKINTSVIILKQNNKLNTDQKQVSELLKRFLIKKASTAKLDTTKDDFIFIYIHVLATRIIPVSERLADCSTPEDVKNKLGYFVYDSCTDPKRYRLV